MNQTQPMPRRSWERGTVQPGGTVPINISGQSGQWRIPVPAGAVRAELLCQGLWGWLQGDGDPALALRGLSGMLAESNGGRLEGIEARMWGAPGDWRKWHAGDQWGRVRLQTGCPSPGLKQLSTGFLRTELGMRKESRTASQADLGLTPTLGTICIRCSINLC